MEVNHEEMMAWALKEAEAAFAEDEVPIGAVLVSPAGQILSRDHNRVEQLSDPSAHAEVLVIRAASALVGAPRLVECTLYTTLEPCPLCAQLISFARLRHVFFGAFDPKSGGLLQGPRIFDHPTCHHKPGFTGGISEARSATLLRQFFQAKRKKPS